MSLLFEVRELLADLGPDGKGIVCGIWRANGDGSIWGEPGFQQDPSIKQRLVDVLAQLEADLTSREQP